MRSRAKILVMPRLNTYNNPCMLLGFCRFFANTFWWIFQAYPSLLPQCTSPRYSTYKDHTTPFETGYNQNDCVIRNIRLT
jgi:hypothetical protein